MLRFAFGVTLAIGLSQLIAWPVGFVAPVFLAMLLQAPRPLSLAGALAFLSVLASALAVGQIIGDFLAYMPLVCILVLALLFCATFYWAQGGASQLHIVLVIIGLTVMPVIGIQSGDPGARVAGIERNRIGERNRPVRCHHGRTALGLSPNHPGLANGGP